MPDATTPSDPPARAVKLAPDDNVAIALHTVPPDADLTVDGVAVRTRDTIPLGHKLAIAPIGEGETVRKHGGPIGSAMTAIQPGEHVHTHNLRSDYLPTYARGESR